MSRTRWDYLTPRSSKSMICVFPPEAPTMLLIFIAAGWVAGIALAALLGLPAQVWLLLLTLPTGYLVIWWREPDLRLFHLFLLAITLGGLRYGLALPVPSSQTVAQFNDQGNVSLIGIVAEEPDRRDAFTDLRIDVTKIQSLGRWENTSGRALVQAPSNTPVQYGDQVQVDGKPTIPPDGADFSYRDFLARESIFTSIQYASVYVLSHGHGSPAWALLLDVKSSGLRAVSGLLPEPAASLLEGILLGNDRGIPSALKDAFNTTNTSHIIAISGFNIAFIALYLGKVARLLFAARPSLADWFVILALAVYTLLVGASASVVRAAIMGVLAVIALRYRREAFALNSLAVAALLMTLFNPYALWDLGFQLSFMATLGLLLYTQPLNNWLERIFRREAHHELLAKVGPFLRDSLVVSLAAWITTTPLLIATFHRLSIVGLLTNLLVLPAQPPIMILGALATLTQMVSSALGSTPLAPLLLAAGAQVMAWGAYVFLQYTILVVQWTAKVPYASIDLPRADWAIVFLLYLVVGMATFYSPRRLANLLLSHPAWFVGTAALATVVLWTSALAAPDQRTHIQFIATGSGDAVFIRTAEDSRILIDGSDEPSALLAHLGEQIPFWDHRLDLIVATNLDEQNLASLNAVLERFDVGRVLEPAPPNVSGVSYKKWRELSAQKGLVSIVARSGTQFQADEVLFDVFSPQDEQAGTNRALRVAMGDHSVFLAPTLPLRELRALVESRSDLASEVAVLPRQVDQESIESIRPRTVIMFVGRSAREQPQVETLKLLEGITVMRTDERGTIEVLIDKDEVEIQSER
jgi:competence protein ComEC